ncbi:hypothetical protein R3P38DRAFT_3190887 [Favolaschia claudopus]|uniref:Chromo domain-containing protein n=1 Tax=Favolaschia claudopus TaxID=2862362 RepID=A0AAW0BP07_9AGAR
MTVDDVKRKFRPDPNEDNRYIASIATATAPTTTSSSPSWTPPISRLAYVTLFTPSKKGILRSRLLQTKTPPNVIPRLDDGKIVVDPISGMIRMPGSVPFVQHIEGRPDEVVTMACAHTLDSIREAYPDIADDLEDLSLRLRDATFGCEAKAGHPAMKPIYTLHGLKRNDRSVDARDLPPGSFDGSYNLATTKGEGEGAGVVMPAVQASTAEAAERIGEVLRLLHAIQRYIIPRSISKSEHAVTEAHSELNNVVSFGGLLPGCTSCQMNVSSDGFDLAHFIGSHQGAWHTDIGDDWTRWTLVTMLLNLPPGSDPGAFCLGRCGLYVREADAWIVFLVFRGNDLHSGFAPTTPPVAVEDVNKLVNAAGPNRVVYVSYPSRVATTRAGSMSMSPPTNFWNYGSTSAAKAEQRHFTDTSSTQIFGGLDTKANRLAREAAYSFANALTHSGIQIDITLTDLMQRMTYRSDDGQTKTIEPPPFDITHQAVEMNRWWRFYEWHRNLCNKYLIRITKDEFRQAQAQIKAGQTAADVPYTALKSVPASVALPQIPPVRGPYLEHVVDSIVKRQVVNGKIVWFVMLDGQNEVTEVDDSESWIHHPPNGPKFAQFLARSQSSQSNPISKHTVGGEKAITTAESTVPLVSHAAPQDVAMKDVLIAIPLPVERTAVPSSSRLISDGTGSAPLQPEQAPVVLSSRLISESVVPVSVPDHDNAVRSPSNEEDNTYDVESIVDIDTTGMEPIWRVRWKDYGPEHDQWKTYAELQDALEVLEAFNKDNNYTLSELISFSRSPSPISSASTSLSAKRKQLADSVDADEESDDLPDMPVSPSLRHEKLGALDKLFTAELRQAELDSLVASEDSIQRTKRYFAPTTTTSIVETLFAQNELQSQFNDYMSFVPQCGSGSQWTQHSAVLSLERVVQAVAVLPELVSSNMKTSILDRSLRWEIARSYLLLYSWFRETAPQLADTLVKLHKSGHWTDEGGYPIVRRYHPAFAGLVHHVVSYVARQAETKHEAKKAKRRQPGGATRNRSFQHPRCPFPIPDDQLRYLPYDLYGLRAGEGKTKRVSLVLPKGHKALRSIDAVYECSALVLQAVWSSELILPPVLRMEQALPQQGRRKSDPDLVRSRAIARGAVLQCIVDSCGGDESILASSDIEGILVSPCQMFPAHLEKESRFASAVLRDAEQTLAPLSDWLAERLDMYPTILDSAAHSARLVHRGLLELHHGVALNEEHYLNPNLLYDDGQDVPFVVPDSLAKHKKGTRKKTVLYQPPTKDSLLPEADAPHFGAIALLLRERCNELRGFPAVDSILFNVLQGRHPTEGRVQFDRDQTDPARQFSNYAQLLIQSLPPSKLTEPLGLSRLLAYMGTGQGNKTSAFLLNGLDPNLGVFPMAFNSLTECIAHFETAELNNITILADHRTKAGSRATSLPGYRQTFNACIWGQASNHLLLQPTAGKGDHKRKYTLEEKFAPYFSPRVQTLWCGFLGDLLGKDPATYSGEKKSWADALQFIIDLKVVGFQSGLTPLQFANNLVFLGICTPPAPEEVGAWIASNKTLGAYNGLTLLGFNLTGYASIVAAYLMVYNHLDTYLCADDKKRLGFGALFVEHLLCKVGRWEYRLRLQKHDFLSMAKQARANSGAWVKGANCRWANHQAFCIPLDIENKSIQTAIDSCMPAI